MRKLEPLIDTTEAARFLNMHVQTLRKKIRQRLIPYIKVGGLGEISERPPVLSPQFAFDHTPPLIEMAYDAFGPRRMMWGSDYPPVSNREGYRNALQGVRDNAAFKSDDDREWVMGKTALNVFKFE